jgi:hypothetical protein
MTYGEVLAAVSLGKYDDNIEIVRWKMNLARALEMDDHRSAWYWYGMLKVLPGCRIEIPAAEIAAMYMETPCITL